MKKNVLKSKKLLVVLMLTAVIISAIAVFVAAEEESIPGLVQSQEQDANATKAYPDATYMISGSLDKLPTTLEAWVYIPASLEKGDVGVILGNSAARTSEDSLNFEIAANRIPTIFTNSKTGYGKNTISFDNSALPISEWVHLALVYDNAGGIVSCYVNGEHSESKYFYPTLSDDILIHDFVLGGDQRELNTRYFKGGLGDVTVYSDVRTAAEIKADCDKGLSMTAENIDRDSVILYYDIDESDKGKNIIDESGNGNDAIFDETWLTEEQMNDIRDNVFGFTPAYTFAVIGDTQKTVRMYPEVIPELYQWIVDNKTSKNIVYSIGLGDITDVSGDGTDSRYDTYRYVEDSSKPYGGYYVIDKSATDPKNEWDVAYHAITIMDGNLEYALLAGNHDDANELNAYFSNNEFYINQFVEHGGIYGYANLTESTDITRASNTWRTLRAGNVDYLIMNLNYNATDAVFDWANEILGREEFKNHKVIISTHAYLHYDGETLDFGNYLLPSRKTSGVDVWEKLGRKHENVKLILSGHIDVDTIVYKQRQGDNGNTVTEMLIDAQSLDKVFHGANMVAMLGFSEDGTKLAVEYYSVSKGMYLKTLSQIAIDLDAEAPVIDESEVWVGMSVAPSGDGSLDNPYLISSAGNLRWMAEQITVGTVDSFDGKYFEQTCDIDLDEKIISSIGYYYGSESDMAAFGGHYDGNGYVIKNGVIAANSMTQKSTVAYGYGLFGVIFGAVIENVTLENVEVVGAGVTGAIVGRAAAPVVSDSNFASFNIISGCEVKDSVKIVLSDISAADGMNFDNASRGGRFGSICGIAHATVIDACVSSANIKFGGDYGIGGGIVGSFGLNSTVSNSAFSGSLTLCDSAATQTSMYGGIAGIISPTTKWGGSLAGYAHIENCYNSGNLYFDVDTLSANTHWAGILAGAPWIPYVAPTDDMPYPYLIENSYNLSSGPERINNKSVYAGITAKNAATAGATSTLYVKDCYSVAVTNAGGDTGTNEYRYVSGTETLDGYSAVYTLGTVASATVSEISGAIENINADISAVRSSETEAVWYSGNGAPTFVPSAAGVKYYDNARKLYYVYDGAKWNLNGGIETEYGIIPESYADAEAFPFVVFKNGEFVTAGDNWNTANVSGLVPNAISQATAKGDVVTIYLRRDFTNTATTTVNTYNQLVGTLNIDLGGNTLTTSRELMQFNHKVAANTVNVNFSNGKIVVAARRLASLLNQSNTVRQDLRLTFKDMTIEHNKTTWSLIEGTDNTTGLCVTDIIFDNCKIDLSAQSTAFNFITSSNDSNKSHVMHVVFKGGEIVSKVNFTGKLMTRNTGYSGGEADTLKFVPDSNGNYTSFTMSSSESAPTNTYNSTGLVYVKSATDEASSTVTYTFVENYIEGYGTIPTEYLDKEKYPFLIFKNGECIGAGNAWNTSKTAGVIPTAISKATSKDDVVSVVLRRDYEHTAAICNNTTSNTYYALVGSLVIDLGGYTITSYRELMQINQKNTDSAVNITVKNGTILVAARGLINIQNQSTSAVSHKLNLTFDNMTLGYVSGTTPYERMIIAEDNSTATAYREAIITFNNSVIDLTDYGTAKSFTLVKVNGDANKTQATKVIFKGGEVRYDADVNYYLISDRLSYGENGADSLTFEKDSSGNYTRIVITEGAKAPTDVYDTKDAVSFALIETANGVSVYQLGENAITAYGEIPFAYSNAEKYPFVLFENGKFAIAYATWYEFCENIGKRNTQESSNATLLVRADHTSTASSSSLYTVKYLTIDLDGHTLTRASYHLFNLSSRNNVAFNTNIKVVNGTICTAHSGMPPISFNSANKSDVEAKFNFVFENVTFTAAAAHSGNLVMEVYKDGTYGSVNTMIFNNCTFDARTGNIKGIFSLADDGGQNKVDINVIVNGGKLLANSNVTLATFDSERVVGEGAPDSLTFGKDSGGDDFVIILPVGAAAPSVSDVYTTADGVECVFVKTSENSGYVNYSLYPEVMVGYKIKTSVTLYSNFVYNIYIPKTNVNSFKINGLAVDYEEVEIDGVTYYRVAVNLPAGDTLSDIALTVTLNTGSTTVDANWTLNVYNYTKSVLAGEFDDTTKTLMKDMLVYASAAHTYFGNTTAVADKLAEINTLLGDYTAVLPTGEAKQPANDTYFTKVEVYVGEVPSFRFYLAEGYTADDFTFKVGKRNANVTVGDGYVEIVMYAYMMLDDVTFTVKGTDVSESYNLYSYYAYAKTLGNANLTAVVEALMKYSVSAKAYRDAVIGA